MRRGLCWSVELVAQGGAAKPSPAVRGGWNCIRRAQNQTVPGGVPVAYAQRARHQLRPANGRPVRGGSDRVLPHAKSLFIWSFTAIRISRLMQSDNGKYGRYIHCRLVRKGRFRQDRFYSCVLDNAPWLPHFNVLSSIRSVPTWPSAPSTILGPRRPSIRARLRRLRG